MPTASPTPVPPEDPRVEAPDAAEHARGGSRTAGVVVTTVVVLVTLVLAAVLFEAQRPGAGLPRDPVGASAPTFALPTLAGGDLALEDLRGQPVVLTFWASWCTTCKADVPKLHRVVEDWGPRGVAVVGVVIDDALSAARAVEEESGLRFPSVFDTYGTVRDAYGVLGTPETFLLGADGRVVARWIGPLPAHEVDLRLAALG
jgi:cytochrome c biogenesis protein CcmG, thiol:disulfide interchange protein DsbE